MTDEMASSIVSTRTDARESDPLENVLEAETTSVPTPTESLSPDGLPIERREGVSIVNRSSTEPGTRLESLELVTIGRAEPNVDGVGRFVGKIDRTASKQESDPVHNETREMSDDPTEPGRSGTRSQTPTPDLIDHSLIPTAIPPPTNGHQQTLLQRALIEPLIEHTSSPTIGVVQTDAGRVGGTVEGVEGPGRGMGKDGARGRDDSMVGGQDANLMTDKRGDKKRKNEHGSSARIGPAIEECKPGDVEGEKQGKRARLDSAIRTGTGDRSIAEDEPQHASGGLKRVKDKHASTRIQAAPSIPTFLVNNTIPPASAPSTITASTSFRPTVSSPLAIPTQATAPSGLASASVCVTGVNVDRIEIDDDGEESAGSPMASRGMVGKGPHVDSSDSGGSNSMDVGVTEHAAMTLPNTRIPGEGDEMIIDLHEQVPPPSSRKRKKSAASTQRAATPTMATAIASVDPQTQLLQLMSLLQQQTAGKGQDKERHASTFKRRGKTTTSRKQKHKTNNRDKRSRRGGRGSTSGSTSASSDSASDSPSESDDDRDSGLSADSSDSDAESDSSVELVDKHNRRISRHSTRDAQHRRKSSGKDRHVRSKSSSRRHKTSSSRKQRVRKSQKAERRMIDKALKGKSKARVASPSPLISARISSVENNLDALGSAGRSIMQHAPTPFDPPGIREAVVANPIYPEQRAPRLVLPKDQRGNDMSLVVWNDKLHTLDDALKPILKWSWIGDDALSRLGNIGWKIGGTGAKVDENGQYYQNEYFETAEAARDTIWRARVTIILPPSHPTLKNHPNYSQLPRDADDAGYLAVARHLGGVREYEDKEGAKLRGDSQNKAIQLAVSLNVLSFLTCCTIEEQAKQSSTNLNKIQFHQSPSSFAPGMIASPFALAGSGKLDFMSGYIADAPKPISRTERKLQERLRRDHNRRAMNEIAPEGEATERTRAEMDLRSASALRTLQHKPALAPIVKPEYTAMKEDPDVVKRELIVPTFTDPMGGYRGLASRPLATALPTGPYRGIASVSHPTHGDLAAPATVPGSPSSYSAFGSIGGRASEILGPLERRLAKEDRLLARHQQTQVKREVQPLDHFDAERAIRRACQQNEVQFAVRTEQVDGSRTKFIAHLKLTARNHSQADYASVQPVEDPLQARAEVYHVAYRSSAVDWISRAGLPLIRSADSTASESEDPIGRLKALSMKKDGYIPMYGHEWINGQVRVWVKVFGKNYPDKKRYGTVEEGYRATAAKILRAKQSLFI